MNLTSALGATPGWEMLLNANRGRASLFNLLLGQNQTADAGNGAMAEANASMPTPPTPDPVSANRASSNAQILAATPSQPSLPAQPASGDRGGVLSMVLGRDNPIAQWAGDNRNWLGTVGTGIANGLEFGDLGQASQMDDLALQQRQQQAQTVEAQRTTAARLRAMGPDYAALADAVEMGVMDPGEATRTVWNSQRDASQQAQELERARANAVFISDPQLRQMVEAGAMSFQDAYKIQTGGAANPVNYGTSLQYGRDEAGNLVPLQAGDNGTLVRSQLPPGVVAIDPGAAAGARAGATFDAKTVAAANAALPAVEQNLGIALDAIDRLRNDKAGLEANFSQWGALPRGMYVQGGTPLANWMTNLNQASGQAFMQARQALKGGGQITDYEGKRAEAAISRISDAAKSGDVQTFLDALDEFEAAVTDGYAKLREVAGGNYQPGAGPGAGTGDIFDRYGLER